MDDDPPKLGNPLWGEVEGVLLLLRGMLCRWDIAAEPQPGEQTVGNASARLVVPFLRNAIRGGWGIEHAHRMAENVGWIRIPPLSVRTMRARAISPRKAG